MLLMACVKFAHELSDCLSPEAIQSVRFKQHYAFYVADKADAVTLIQYFQYDKTVFDSGLRSATKL